MNRPFLLIPIETKVREFHAKALLSCFAAEAGFHVILGGQNEMHHQLRFLPRGIYLDKSIAITKAKFFRRFRKLGNRVAAWCEEGLVFLDPDTYLKERISIDSYNLVDSFFAWGKVQERVVGSRISGSENKICCTGNPRFDLLRHPFRNIFSPQAEAIRKRHGPFILIDTSFSRYNHFHGRDFVVRTMKEQGRLQSPEDEAFLVRWADYHGEMYRHFLAMSKRLSHSFPEVSIIIRPHPSESLETWKNETRMLSNVKVIQEGSAAPWIMASKVMIHNGCTTGVEAYVLEQPVLCYCPIASETYDSELPNALGRKADSLDVLTALVQEAMSSPSGFRNRSEENIRRKALAGEYVESLTGSTASEKIVSVLRGLVSHEVIPKGVKKEDSFLWPFLRRLQTWVIWAKPAARRIVKGRAGGYAYLNQKFPGLSLEEVQQVLDAYKEVSGRFKNVEAAKAPGTTSCFVISQGF